MKEFKRDEEQEKEIKKAQKEGYGIKFDEGKERYDLIPPWALNELAKVYTYGTIKYDDNNWWKGMEWGKLFSALMRHTWKWWRGEKLDDESGLHHLSHAAWQCFALIEYERTNVGEDARVPEAMDLKETDEKPVVKDEPKEETKCEVCGFPTKNIIIMGKGGVAKEVPQCTNSQCSSRKENKKEDENKS